MALMLTIVMILMLLLAIYTDLSTRRVPNALTLPVAAIGIVVHLVTLGVDGLLVSIAGWLTGVLLLLVPFILRGIGAGDVKLLAAVGALHGPLFALMTCLYGALLGGVIAIVLLGRTGRIGIALQSLASLRFLSGPLGTMVVSGKVPYAPAIAMGALVALGMGAAG